MTELKTPVAAPLAAAVAVALPQNIFNTAKSDYAGTVDQSLFLGEDPGLFDTVHRNFPKIWELYKTMKSLDWDELEFDFSSCNLEFKTASKAVAQCMIRTLAWQWEADSVAANTLLVVMAPFISAPELQAAYGRITDNEVLHASTYSEIVRSSFDDPNTVLNEVLQVKEAMQRLRTVAEVLSKAKRISSELSLGLRSKDDPEVYDAILMAEVAFLVLERIQFMASFAVTFAIGETGLFMPIAKAVQKICQDEYEIHVQTHKEVLLHELRLPRGKEAFGRLRPLIKKLIDEVTLSELTWTEYALDGNPLVGLTAAKLKEWVLFSAKDVYEFFAIGAEFTFPKANPLPYMERWMDMSKTQASPQEQQNGQYKVNVIQRTDEGKVFQVDW
ncbi:ribonucleotide reductase of class Ia (aerobic), beta subunit [Xanthomonas phage vB_XciM_LucasX]|nr:ribonucleotide reductase of class Ia (aerobic), beta subunit [Xanthomonas phage vB_XciM_LucasX]